MNLNEFCVEVCEVLMRDAAADRMRRILENDPTRYGREFLQIRKLLEQLPPDGRDAIASLVNVCLLDALSGVFGALDGNPVSGTGDTGLRLATADGEIVKWVQEEFLTVAEERGLLVPKSK